jgi:hypothetical protein
MKYLPPANPRVPWRMAGLGLIFLLGCAQSQPLTFLDETTGPDAANGSGGNEGTGGMPIAGSGGSGSGGMTGTGGTGSGGIGTGGSGSGGTAAGGTGSGGVGTGGSGSGGVGTGGSGSGGTGMGGTTGTGGRGSGGSTGSGGGAGGGMGGNVGGLGGGTGTGGASGRGGSGGQAGSAGTGGAGGGSAATFTQVYKMILDAPASSPSSCMGSSCHIPAPGSAGITYDTQADAYRTLLVNAVVPGNAANSILYMYLSSGTMPKGRTKLSATLIALVASWINAGALNN